jgi:ParB family chromosome partitioning protein
VATPKKGQGIAFKIPDHVEEPEVTSERQADCQASELPRTGVGMLSRMLSGAAADTEAVSKLNAEIEKLKLQVGEQLIDPRQIALTRWADRHPDSFSSQAFRGAEAGDRECRRQRAADQGTTVRGGAGAEHAGGAALRTGLRFPPDSRVPRTRLAGARSRRRERRRPALYVQMQRENRGRSNLSAWEQGVSYHKALNEGLFPSARRLAEQIGLDHSNVAKALRVAELPQEIVGAFRSPVDIQFRWAVALDKAYQQDPDAVLSAPGCSPAGRRSPPPRRCFAA